MNRAFDINVEVAREGVGFEADQRGVSNHAVRTFESSGEGAHICEISGSHLGAMSVQFIGEIRVAHDRDRVRTAL
jgi:hypothetical protein